ncbi:MAG TPA: polyprenyl synthetase family protein [Actinomycetota bacterium]|nr:polyprenyl synthetase family protein [Actinomycetota bacterium]
MTRGRAVGLEAPDPVLEAELRQRLDQVEASLERAVRSDTEFVTRAASYLVAAGGKRFRPMLVLLGGYFGDPTDPRLIHGATAIEIVHLATLYHDDVIDEAETRRGRPSVNAQWGNNVAILTGDFLFARASEISAELGTEVSRLLAQTIAVLCDGQIREVEMAGRFDHSEEAYMEVIRRKTAKLIATSSRLGGMLSGAPEQVVERLDEVGTALGMAFQLSDDIMDVVAGPEELLKEPGQDMREGVYTLPVLYALRDGEAGRELARILAQGPPQGERLRRALEIVRQDGSLGRAREAVTVWVRRAKAAARPLPASRARDALVHVADYLARRCGARA